MEKERDDELEFLGMRINTNVFLECDKRKDYSLSRKLQQIEYENDYRLEVKKMKEYISKYESADIKEE